MISVEQTNITNITNTYCDGICRPTSKSIPLLKSLLILYGDWHLRFDMTFVYESKHPVTV